MVVISGTLRFVQESRSGDAAEKLLDMITTTCTVTRKEEGKQEIKLDEVVVGDIVYLSAGDMIPADVRILEAKDLFVSQASLTGESEPIEKLGNIQEKNENIPVEDKSKYVEFKLSELAIVFSSNGNINIFPHLSAEQLNKIKDPFQTTVTSTTASMGEKKLLYVPFYFTNGGIGTAVNFSLQIFENEKFIVASQPLSLAPSEEVKVSFYSDDYHWVAPKYEIRLVYSDIYKTKYTQRHSISFDNKEKAFALSAEVDQSEIDA